MALFAVFGLVACGDEELSAECNTVPKSYLPDDQPTCKISDYKEDIGYCTDEDAEDVYFTYKGSGHYETDEALVKVVCPNATINDKNIMINQMTREGKSLIERIRMRAI